MYKPQPARSLRKYALENLRMLLLLLLLLLLPEAHPEYVVQQVCNFEEGGDMCGWQVNLETSEGECQISQANAVPFPAPGMDFSPGTATGKYFQCNISSESLNSIELLFFPSQKYVLNISLAFYLIGPLDLELLQVNSDAFQLTTDSMWNEGQPVEWELTFVSFSNTVPGGISIIIPPLEPVAEAALETELSLGIDNLALFFSLPCNFDSIYNQDPGSLVLKSPVNSLSITLGNVSSLQFSANSSVCPDGPFIFEIEGVSVAELEPVFIIDSLTGLIVINATGPHLVGGGATGILTVSVHVQDSDYKQTGSVVKKKTVLPFQQGPTILIHSPATLTVEINKPFSYTIVAQSSLASNTQLKYSDLQTVPSSLADFLTINGNNVTGTIPSSSLSSIYELTTTPSFSVDIGDSYGGTVTDQVQILIKEAPPMFNSTHYIFTIDEDDTEDVNDVVGSVYVLDPNGDTCQELILNISTTDQVISNEFHIFYDYFPSSDVFCQFYVAVTTTLDYEERTSYIFTVTASDTTGQISDTLVTVSVQPVNEYAPQFSLNHYVATITDVSPPDTEVAQLPVSDSDDGEDGSLSCSITEGNTQQFFAIHMTQSSTSMTTCTVVVNISPIQPGSHILTINAEDGGSPPKSDDAVVNVTVLATTNIKCDAKELGPPVLTGSAVNSGYKAFHTDVTLYCNFTANPPAFPLQWIYQHINTLNTVTISSNSKYTVEENYLTIFDALPDDNGLYQCNVTNLCGSKQEAYFILVLEYPYPPTGLKITISGPSSAFLSGLLTWTPSLYDVTTHPVDGYHLKLMEEGETDYTSLSIIPFTMSSGTLVHETTVNKLKPGTSYAMKMASYNIAGESESEVLNFATPNSPPRLKFLSARPMLNQTLLVEWTVLYTGGSNKLNLNIVIQYGTAGGKERDTMEPVVMSFDPTVTNQFVSPVLESAHQYTITSDISSEYGSNQEMTYAFIGYEDSIYCGFSSAQDTCQWEIQGEIVNVSSLSSPKPMVDAMGDPAGCIVTGTVHSNDEQTPILTYPTFSYICGFSFFFQVYDNMRLLLQTSNGTNLWASSTMDVTEWEFVEYLSGQFPFTITVEGLVFVAEKTGVTSTFSYAAVDEVILDFCLPCDLSTLSSESFSLTVPNYVTIHLREEKTIPVKVKLDGCENAVLHFSITSVVPNHLAGSFFIPDSRQGSVVVSPISSDIAEAGTTGMLEIEVSIAQSDYMLTGSYTFTTANIHFGVDEKYANCSFEDTCDFEFGPCHWEFVNTDSSTISTDAKGNSFLSSTVPKGDLNHITELWRTAINDSYCGLSFVYKVESALLQVSVEGLGEVWSSSVVMTTTTLPQWESVIVYMDVKGVEHADVRQLIFEMVVTNGDSGSVAVDNVTLHPCVNCEAKECSCVSCIQQCSMDPCQSGYYLSLEVNQCRACPRGHYCENWNQLPVPCPPGTSNNQTGASSPTNCKICPSGTYSLQNGASTCQICPQGEYLDLHSGLCQACEPGYMCQAGAKFPCSPGYYTNHTMSTNCSSCPPGSFCPESDQEPQPCAEDQYSSGGQAACSACPVGSRPSQDGSSCVFSTDTLFVTGLIGMAAGIFISGLFGCLCWTWCKCQKWKRRKRMKEHERHMYMDNFVLHTERSLDNLRDGKQQSQKSSSIRTASTVMSLTNQYWDDSLKTTHMNQAYVESDSSEESEVSEQKSVSGVPEVGTSSADAERIKVLATGHSEGDVSALIELDSKDDHVWDALQQKKMRKKESEF